MGPGPAGACALSPEPESVRTSDPREDLSHLPGNVQSYFPAPPGTCVLFEPGKKKPRPLGIGDLPGSQTLGPEELLSNELVSGLNSMRGLPGRSEMPRSRGPTC